MAEEQKKTENVIIIGGGPAGLAASIYNIRAALNPLVFGGSPYGGQLMLTSDVENYPGFDSILGPQLIEKMRTHTKKFGTRIIDKNITKVDFSERPFKVYTDEQEEFLAQAILITTGARALWLGLESEKKLRGKGVSACAVCDAFFFRDKTVAVVGGGDTAMEEALTLAKTSKKVYIIHRRDAFRASKIMQDRVLKDPKIEVLFNKEIAEIRGENRVEGIRLKTGEEMQVEGVFIAIGHKPDTDFLRENGVLLDEKGFVVTSAVAALAKAKGKDFGANQFNFDWQYMTSVPGVFAAGDNVDYTFRQAGTAVGMGIAAALEVERWLETST